jgi:hypothetical protein
MIKYNSENIDKGENLESTVKLLRSVGVEFQKSQI